MNKKQRESRRTEKGHWLLPCSPTRAPRRDWSRRSTASMPSGKAASDTSIPSGTRAECLPPDRYDDGGFSGGTIERPALKRLLADIEAGKIDCVVVYKVDRLSRSLMDFARMMQVFESQVSFVSVTQQFNTPPQHGPADAEYPAVLRPVRAGDHLRADARQDRGSQEEGQVVRRQAAAWLRHPLQPGRIEAVVNEPEAEQVRAIYQFYMEHEALIPTLKEVNEGAAGSTNVGSRRRAWRRAAIVSTRRRFGSC